MARARALLETGGAKVAELDYLLGSAEQFSWGDDAAATEVAALLPRLRDAKSWVAQVRPSFHIFATGHPHAAQCASMYLERKGLLTGAHK